MSTAMVDRAPRTPMAAGLSAPRSGPRWSIKAYEGDDRAPRYAVYRGGQRVVWGLRTKATAARWILRLGGMAPLADAADGRDKESDDGRDEGGQVGSATEQLYRGETPWWSR